MGGETVCVTGASGFIRSWLVQLLLNRGYTVHATVQDGPPKLKHFLWSACQGNMAVKERLRFRHIVEDAVCPICGAVNETIIHTLFECKAALEIWSVSELRDVIVDAPSNSFGERWRWLAKKCTLNTLRRIGALLWVAWRCRNLMLFNGEQPNEITLAAEFMKMVEEYALYATKVFSNTKVNREVENVVVWRCPERGCVKVNVDAHIGAGTVGGIGVVVRDEKGGLLVAAKRRINIMSPGIAEAMAVRYGLIVARRLGFSRVQVESDAMTVIQGVMSMHRGYAPIFHIFQDIRMISSDFVFCNFSHVKRSCNTVAHNVARWDTNDCDERICIGEFPQSLLTLANLDLI